jgi:hypothetical protein
LSILLRLVETRLELLVGADPEGVPVSLSLAELLPEAVLTGVTSKALASSTVLVRFADTVTELLSETVFLFLPVPFTEGTL